MRPVHIINYDKSHPEDDYIYVQYPDRNPVTITRSESPVRFERVVEALSKNDYDEVQRIISIRAVTSVQPQGISIKGEQVYYNGKLLAKSMCEKYISLVTYGGPNLQAYEKFITRVMLNPSEASRADLDLFLLTRELPILEDGRFLAYKGVKEDYMDCHSGRFSNRIGQVNKILRKDVDPDRNVACSYGFHVGSYAYAKSFMPQNGHLMFVAISPECVVSVPVEANVGKCRVCEYEVIGEDLQLFELNKPLYEKQDNGEYQLDNSLIVSRDTQLNLDKMLLKSLIERYHLDGLNPTIRQISEATKLAFDYEYIYDLAGSLGYIVEYDDEELKNLQIYPGE
jgi:hypothetical protein